MASSGRLNLMFLAMCLIWGSTWIAAKVGISVVPPILFVSSRFIVAGTAMVLFLWRRGGLPGFARDDLPRLAAVTVLMVMVPYAMLFWGARYVSSSLTAILDLAFMPVALLGIGALLGEERFTRVRACGVAVGVVGLCLLFGPKALAGSGQGARSAALSLELWGAGAIVASAMVYALGSVLARPLLRRYPPTQLACVTMLAGGAVLFASSLAAEPGAIAALSGRWGRAAWAGWAFLVLFGSIIAYTVYLQLVREWGAARAGAYAFVSPAIAAVLGVAVFHEAVSGLDVLGMATMLAGAWLTLRPAEAGIVAAVGEPA